MHHPAVMWWWPLTRTAKQDNDTDKPTVPMSADGKPLIPLPVVPKPSDELTNHRRYERLADNINASHQANELEKQRLFARQRQLQLQQQEQQQWQQQQQQLLDNARQFKHSLSNQSSNQSDDVPTSRSRHRHRAHQRAADANSGGPQPGSTVITDINLETNEVTSHVEPPPSSWLLHWNNTDDPSRISCKHAFDTLMYCFTPANQVRNIYRTGRTDSCAAQFTDIHKCLQIKAEAIKSTEAAQYMLYQTYEPRLKEIQDIRREHVWKYRRSVPEQFRIVDDEDESEPLPQQRQPQQLTERSNEDAPQPPSDKQTQASWWSSIYKR